MIKIPAGPLGVDTIESAERIIEAYAEGIEGLSNDDCEELVEDKIVTGPQCTVLQEALRGGAGGIVTDEEAQKLYERGLLGGLINAIRGDDGRKALQARAKALGETASSFFESTYIQVAAIQELGLMGEDGIPGLCEVATERFSSPVMIARALSVLNEIPESSYSWPALDTFIKDASSPYSDVSFNAVTGLAKHKEGGKLRMVGDELTTSRDQKVKAFIKALGNGNEGTRNIASAALIKAGVDAVPDLLEAAKDQSGKTTNEHRANAIRVLGEIDSISYQIQIDTVLIVMLSGHDALYGIGQAVADALVKRGPLAASAVANALNNSDSRVRARAADVLGRMGSVAAFAVPQLTESLHDSELDVRVSALTALWLIDKETAKGVMNTSTLKNVDLSFRESQGL